MGMPGHDYASYGIPFKNFVIVIVIVSPISRPNQRRDITAISNATYTSGASTITCYIRNTATGPARRLATHQVWYDQNGKSVLVEQIAATLTISFPRWCLMSSASYWGQQRMSLASYPGHVNDTNLWVLSTLHKYMCWWLVRLCERGLLGGRTEIYQDSVSVKFSLSVYLKVGLLTAKYKNAWRCEWNTLLKWY